MVDRLSGRLLAAGPAQARPRRPPEVAAPGIFWQGVLDVLRAGIARGSCVVLGGGDAIPSTERPSGGDSGPTGANILQPP